MVTAVKAGLAAGALCAMLACVPTAWYAEQFAHPARVARLGGAVPEATVAGAVAFRGAAACAAVLIPLLSWALVRMCREPARRARAAWPRDRRGWLVLAAITAAGAALRVALASESLWYDEISAFLSFAIEGPGVAFGSYAVPTNHVPMTLAVWLMWSASGGSLNELVLRAPALLAGVAAIPVAYALTATLFPRRAAPLGALVAAVAPVLVLGSAEARGYAFVMPAALIAALALARAMRTRATADYAVFAGACAFGAWAHPVAILVPFAAGVIGLVRDRRLAVAALLSGVLAALLLAPLMGDVLAARRDYLQSSGDQPTVFSREGYEALLGLTLSWSDRWLALPNLPLACVFCIGAWALVHRRRARVAIMPFALAFALAFALSIVLGTWLYARFLLFAVPIGVITLTAAGARSHRRAVIVGSLVVVSSLASIAMDWRKQPIRDAVAAVAARRASDDGVATIGLPDNAVGFYAQQFGFMAADTGFLGKDLAAVMERDRPRFVVVLYPDRVADGVLRLLDADFDRTHRLEGWADWGAGAVEVWERPR
jgi:hypothetical protein